MISRRPAPALGVRSPGTLLATLLLALVSAILPASAAVAQTTDQLVEQRRKEYVAAKAQYESALGAWGVLERQFGDALEQLRTARRTGNADALAQANARAYEIGIPFGAQEVRVASTLEALDDARERLMEIIQVRLEQLSTEADQASSAQRRNQVNLLFRDLYNELQALDRERAEGFRLAPIVMPDVLDDPRDGPTELGQKADLLERRAATADSAIVDIDHQIKSLNDRIRIQRQGRDMLANLDRFDDTRLPVTSGQPTGDRTAPDSSTAGPVPVTPEEQLHQLREMRQHLENYRNQVLARARQFRDLVRSVSS